MKSFAIKITLAILAFMMLAMLAIPGASADDIARSVAISAGTSESIDINGDGLDEIIMLTEVADGLLMMIDYPNGTQFEATLPCPPNCVIKRIGAAQLVGGVAQDIAVLAHDNETERNYVYLIDTESPDVFIKMPSYTDPYFQYRVSFSRNFLLEIQNRSESLFVNVTLPVEVFEPLYRDDGSAPGALTASFGDFEDMRVEYIGSSNVLTLIQYVYITVLDEPIARVESTLASRDDGVTLIRQRVLAE